MRNAILLKMSCLLEKLFKLGLEGCLFKQIQQFILRVKLEKAAFNIWWRASHCFFCLFLSPSNCYVFSDSQQVVGRAGEVT